MAAHLGEIDEIKINNMSYVFFDDVLSELGHRLNYEAVVNYAGNAFCEKSWDMITKSNPFHVGEQTASNNLMGFFSNSRITVLNNKEGNSNGTKATAGDHEP